MLQRVTQVARLLCPALLCLCQIPGQAVAQTASPCSGVGGTNVSYGSMADHPFTATVHVTSERRLADGNVIRGDATLHQWRDSAGRVRSENIEGCDVDDSGKPVARMRISISDPTNRTYESWSESPDQGKTAQISHYAVPEPPSKEELARLTARARVQRVANAMQTEKLGTRTIAGVLATGIRTTRTTQPGEIGNDLPIQNVQEQWVSRNVGVLLLSTSDSPMSGHQIIEVTELILGEPNASLFSPPADYKVLDTQPVVRAAATGSANGQ